MKNQCGIFELKPASTVVVGDGGCFSGVIWHDFPRSMSFSAGNLDVRLKLLIEAFKEYDPSNEGLNVITLIDRLYPKDIKKLPTNAASIKMRSALETIIRSRVEVVPTARKVSLYLASIRRQFVDGWGLDEIKTRSDRKWILRQQ